MLSSNYVVSCSPEKLLVSFWLGFATPRHTGLFGILHAKSLRTALIQGLGFAGIFVLGCLAALAIPAFVKYIQASKAAEAHANVRMIVHDVTYHYQENCEFPASLPALADTALCCGGNTCLHIASAGEAWAAAGISAPMEPTYFSYETERIGDHEYRVRAVADFSCGGPNHTYEITIQATPEDGGCSVQALPPVFLNEYQ